MRKPIGKRIHQVCEACEQESTFSEIAFLMGLSDKTGNVFRQITKAVDFGFITKTGYRNTSRYTAKPNWRALIKAHNEKPQTKELPDYEMPIQYKRMAIGRVNSIFNMGASA